MKNFFSVCKTHQHLFIKSIAIVVMTSFAVAALAQQPVKPYLNTKLTIEARVNDLVSKLNLQQKIKLLQYRGTPVQTSELEIPAYNWWNECLHGVARAGKATVFPQAIGFAATWDAPLIQSVADAIASEARAKYEYFSAKGKRDIYQGLNFWTPNINIFRDPRWGRGMETYGEDPFLTGKIAAAFVRGLQGNNPKYYKTIATIKHFAVHSGPESSRHRYNANVSDRDFYTTYAPAFKMAIDEAGVYSLMCAYNRFRDTPCCGSKFLLTDLLRNQWGFKGFIVTDCGAVDDFYKKNTHEVVTTPEAAAAMAIKAGVDLECGDVFNALDIAVQKNMVSEAELDVSIKRLFTARFKLGLFDPSSAVPFAGISYKVVESVAHKNLARIAAQKSIVLLKNENNTLPLKKSIKTIAVIGPNADNEEVLLANYNGYPTHVVTPLEGIRKKLPGVQVLYAKGSTHVDGLPTIDVIPSNYLFTTAEATEQGLQAMYYGNSKFEGTAMFTRTDKNIDFSWIDKAPGAKMDEQNFSATWSGYLKAPVDGDAILDLYGGNQYELLVDGKSLLKFNSDHHAEHKYAPFNFIKNQLYKIEIRFSSRGASAQLKFNWQLPGTDLTAAALSAAAKADVVVMCMGLSPRIEGEEMKIKLDGFSGGDRTALKLPDVQEKLIKAIAATGKPIVLVMISGSAVAINWEQQQLPAIIEAWYGGQHGGNAIADVLFGDYNPAGRLPVTFYTSENELPDFENYDMKGRTYRYYEGVPLYPFGHGLSYTTFTYSNLLVSKTAIVSKPIKVTAVVKNSGNRDGEEVVQLYLKHTNAPVPVPLKSLKGFQRITLKKGESKTVTFTLQPQDFSIINDDGKMLTVPGNFLVSVGGGQPLQNNKTATTSNVITTTIQLK